MINRISIIIPVLNEANTIGSLLQYLIENSKASQNLEIIVVDGGSTDGTQDIIKKHILDRAESKSNDDLSTSLEETGIRLISAPKGRAKQMNFGAKNATGKILYFLHADSFPPKHFDALIISEVENGHKAGCFRMQFDSNHWWLCLAGWFTQFNWKACRGGDQSLFITKKIFNEIGGFDESYSIYEDNILIQELYKRKEFTVINKKLQTSARMYNKHGIWKVQYHYFKIHIKRWFGASADELLVYYKKHLSH
jgi:rSAM/selenodomain-associated transferase 2